MLLLPSKGHTKGQCPLWLRHQKETREVQGQGKLAVAANVITLDICIMTWVQKKEIESEGEESSSDSNEDKDSDEGMERNNKIMVVKNILASDGWRLVMANEIQSGARNWWKNRITQKRASAK